MRNLIENPFEINMYQMFKDVMKKIPDLCLNTLTKPEVHQLFEDKYDWNEKIMFAQKVERELTSLKL